MKNQRKILWPSAGHGYLVCFEAIKMGRKNNAKIGYFLKINWILQYTKNVLICERDKEKKHTIQNDWMWDVQKKTNERDLLNGKLIKMWKKRISTKLVNAGNNSLRKEIRNFCSRSVSGDICFWISFQTESESYFHFFSTFYRTELSIRSL